MTQCLPDHSKEFQFYSKWNWITTEVGDEAGEVTQHKFYLQMVTAMTQTSYWEQNAERL